MDAYIKMVDKRNNCMFQIFLIMSKNLKRKEKQPDLFTNLKVFFMPHVGALCFWYVHHIVCSLVHHVCLSVCLSLCLLLIYSASG